MCIHNALHLKDRLPIIPYGSLVLVTGVIGFPGSQVADQLVQAGHKIRGTFSDTPKTTYMKDMFDTRCDGVEVAAVMLEDIIASRTPD